MSTKSDSTFKICCICCGVLAIAVVIYLLTRKPSSEKFGSVDISPVYTAPVNYKGCTTTGPTLVLLWNSEHGDQPDAILGWNKVRVEVAKYGIKTVVLDKFDNTIYRCDGIEEIKNIQTFLNKEIQYPEIRFYMNGYASRKGSKLYMGPLQTQDIIDFTIQE
jgi:hypothetical protein